MDDRDVKKWSDRLSGRRLLPILLATVVIAAMPGYSQKKVEVINRTKASVVWIHAFQMPYSVDEASYKTGTGYVAGPNGLIITNHHVINDINGLVIYAPTVDHPFYGTVVWADSVLDLAVIKAFDCTIRPLVLADEDSISVGDETLILGYPGQGYKTENLKVSWGLISSNPADSTIQTTAAINSGNSGGPAINLKGEVIGTVFAKMVGLSIEGTGFIRNIKYARLALEKAAATKTPAHRYFGTANFEAYKKICDAAIIGWKASRTEDESAKENMNKQAKDLMLKALDDDPDFCEAYYFLAAYNLNQYFSLCRGNKDKEARTELENFRQAFRLATEKAEKQRPSLVLSGSVLNDLGKKIKDSDISCSQIRDYYNEIIYAYLNKEERWTDLLEYLNSGKSPDLLKKALNISSVTYSSYRGSTGTTVSRPAEKSTVLKIGAFDKYSPVRFSFMYTLPFSTFKSNLGFSFGNAGRPSGNYVFFKNQLSFQVLQDLGEESSWYDYQRYLVMSYNLGIQVKFAKSLRFNPKPYVTVGYNPMNYQFKGMPSGKTDTWYWNMGAFNFGVDLDAWINGSVGLSFSWEYTLYFDKVFPSLYDTKLNLKYTSLKVGLIF